MDPQRHSKTGLHDARTTSYYAAEGSVVGRLLANRAIARDDTPRSAAHATRTSSTSECACSAHRPDAIWTAPRHVHAQKESIKSV